MIGATIRIFRFRRNWTLTDQILSCSHRLLIPKLEDANLAGGPRGGECTLILTEGDSAKALAVSGLSVVGRDTYGVFPLRGKPLNVREASHSQLRDNAELNNIKAILGLQHSKRSVFFFGRFAMWHSETVNNNDGMKDLHRR